MLERDLEDAICKDPEGILGDGYRILYRQLSLDHGRLDILAWHDHIYDGRVYMQTIEAIELKRGTIKAKDVSQVLRYIYDLENGLANNSEDTVPFDFDAVDTSTVDGLARIKLADMLFRLQRPITFVHGVLIGRSIEAEALCAAHAAYMDVFLWSIVEGTVHLDSPDLDLDSTPDQPWALEVIELARQAAQRQAERELAETDEG